MRNTNVRNADRSMPIPEEEMLQKINALGIGSQGMRWRQDHRAGGQHRKMPTHIAGLPIAVNINCHVTVTRRWSCKGGGEGYGKENNNSLTLEQVKDFKMWRQRADFGRHLYCHDAAAQTPVRAGRTGQELPFDPKDSVIYYGGPARQGATRSSVRPAPPPATAWTGAPRP